MARQALVVVLRGAGGGRGQAFGPSPLYQEYSRGCTEHLGLDGYADEHSGSPALFILSARTGGAARVLARLCESF